MSKKGGRAVRDWGLAATAAEREELYAFRYAHYFNRLTDAPGTDHVRRRVYSPHDEESVHLTGRNADGELLIVGTGTRASSPRIPELWRKALQLDRLAPLQLDKILISSRLVVREDCRGGSVFPDFFKYSARYFTSRGYAHTVHYCTPPLVPLYERLGYRMYGEGFTLPSGLYRIPMILVAFDETYLARAAPAFLQATCGLRPEGNVEDVLSLLPELTNFPLCALPGRERLPLIRSMSAPRQPDGEKTLIPDTAERILRRSSILPLAPGVSPAHAEDPPLLWFVLEGECRLRHTDGTESVAKPGMFINGRACTSFTAREPGKILFFASAAAAAIAGPPVLPSSFWEKLGGSCAEKRY